MLNTPPIIIKLTYEPKLDNELPTRTKIAPITKRFNYKRYKN